MHPAPSSVSLAFARAGLSWDDAVVVSAHGRRLDAAAVAAAPKAAVLTGPETPPEAVGRALPAGVEPATSWVCSRLGEPGRDRGPHRHWPVWPPEASTPSRWSSWPGPASTGRDAPSVTWRGFGRPVAEFAHRAGMITKPEVRAVVLSKLDLHPAATLWDVGAGSGSVAVEAARMVPGLRAWAIERRPDDSRRIAANAEGLAVTVVEGDAPGCLAGLPDPDRAFVGGGGIEVLDAVCARMAPGGVVVATFAALDRAGAAAARLGNLVQITVNRARPIGADGAVRLDADNPVFVAWGPAT